MTDRPGSNSTVAIVVLANMIFINILAFIGDMPTTSLVSSILLGGFAIYLVAVDKRE